MAILRPRESGKDEREWEKDRKEKVAVEEEEEEECREEKKFVSL